MKPEERYDWIIAYASRPGSENYRVHMDILNSDFVWDYIEATEAPHKIQFFGAPKCAQLGRDLSKMYEKKMLRRYTCGVGNGLSGQGFPKWVYVYKL
jgi:hypothetical protein